MAEYTRENPRRSPRDRPAVSYVQTRQYNRSAVVAKAPAKKAPAKKAAKNASVKKAPKKKSPMINSQSSGNDEESGADKSEESQPKKALVKTTPAKKTPVKKNPKKRTIQESFGDLQQRRLEARTVNLRKRTRIPQHLKMMKSRTDGKLSGQESGSSKPSVFFGGDEFLDDEDDYVDIAAPATPMVAVDAEGNRLKPPDDEAIINYENLNPYHNRWTLEAWVLDNVLDGDIHEEIEGLVDDFSEQLRRTMVTLEEIRVSPNDPHATYAEIYQLLTWDPESPRAALEAELRRRGQLRDVRYFTIDGLRLMFNSWMEFFQDSGEPQTDGELEVIIMNFLFMAGLEDEMA
ncbi:hypothetical protein N431DRAFT_518317 [Stipitochalara longipes BDJ]|nr:hypothetical protein N431DRAFT_518317 [Stipitochalara longipes BDJ]